MASQPNTVAGFNLPTTGGFTADTSSYSNYAQRTDPLDTINKLQGIENSQTIIDKNKLELMNTRTSIINQRLSTLINTPNLTHDIIMKEGQHLVKLGLIPPDMFAKFATEIPKDPSQLKGYIEQVLKRVMSTTEMVNNFVVKPEFVDDGSGKTPMRISPFVGPEKAGERIATQPPPTSETTNPVTGEKKMLGPQQYIPPAGGNPNPYPLPVQGPQALPTGPIQNPALYKNTSPLGDRVLSAVVEPPQQPQMTPNQRVAQRFNPIGPTTALPPGVAEAMRKTGEASGEQFAQDVTQAGNYQRRIYPLVNAIKGLEALGTKGTGPGTEIINNLKSFILSNIPGVDKNHEFFKSVPTYDKTQKFLVDVVNQMGGSQRSVDHLAAAISGNPSMKMSNAAATDVAKSMLALDNMKQALTLEASNNKIPKNQYSEWLLKRQSEIDPRAFAVNMMTPEAKAVLKAQLNKNPREADRFLKSYKLGSELGLIQ